MNYDKVPELPEVPDTTARRSGKLWFSGICLVLLAGTAAWWHLGNAGPAVPAAEETRRSAQIAGVEEALDRLRARLAAVPEDSAPATRRALLEEMVARQTELISLRQPPAPADGVQLAGWQAQLEEAIARERARQSRELETAAAELVRQRQPEAALEKLREALRLQREINGGMSVGTAKSYGREARLQQEIEELTAETRRSAARPPG